MVLPHRGEPELDHRGLRARLVFDQRGSGQRQRAGAHRHALHVEPGEQVARHGSGGCADTDEPDARAEELRRPHPGLGEPDHGQRHQLLRGRDQRVIEGADDDRVVPGMVARQ
jgi:hypothetical protein